MGTLRGRRRQELSVDDEERLGSAEQAPPTRVDRRGAEKR
jgi:hypothetical protein